MSNDNKNTELCESIWSKYEVYMKNLCSYKLSSHPSEIDDVIGELYLALCDAISSGNELHNPKAWLYSTANNIIKSKYTEINKMKKMLVNIDSVENELFYDIDFIEPYISDENIDVIRDDILNELNDAEKELYNLIYEKKLKFKEIAKMYSTNVSTIKQRHYRLKRKIMQSVKDTMKKL